MEDWVERFAGYGHLKIFFLEKCCKKERKSLSTPCKTPSALTHAYPAPYFGSQNAHKGIDPNMVEMIDPHFEEVIKRLQVYIFLRGVKDTVFNISLLLQKCSFRMPCTMVVPWLILVACKWTIPFRTTKDNLISFKWMAQSWLWEEGNHSNGLFCQTHLHIWLWIPRWHACCGFLNII